MKVEEVCPQKYIEVLSKALKEEKKVERPAEADYIKTGHGKELAPSNPDWYHIRAASILRKLYIEQLKNSDKMKHGFGTLWFAKVYGGAKNNGHKPSHTVTGSKSLVRGILQALESSQLVTKIPKGGRKLTSNGISYMETIATRAAELSV
ncbi:small subunit ribosomal protein S19e [Nematocida sp. LUAm3]|nr:small subunit ribosomal protein S19e [Nematocida sp. LUAm3]KAI5175235.1 small subunit ribosomal protein S19e [Nematocida sp. LUAm2]KAI5178093.1 small subunit ribosomal protein S19e [Nematocida sp. LUAm1]